jgi:phage head maturation protease
MPASWPAAECWEPDKVFAQIQAGLLNAKSIGWVPTKAHFADVKEAAKNNWHEGMLIVEEWLLIEYAVGTVPVNPETVVEVVSKLAPPKPDDERSESSGSVAHITLEELEKSLENRIESIDISRFGA